MGAVGYVSDLDAASVGADPAGTAAAAVAAHAAAVDPHADRAYTDDEIEQAEAEFVTASRTITAGTGLIGGGDLSADRTISANVGTSAGTLAAGDHSHTAAAVGADPAGTATAAVAAHVGATDPHGDRGYTDTAVAGRVPTSRSITAGTGLTGGGTLAADRSLAVAYGSSAGTAAQGNDSRLSDARTPTTHSHSVDTGGTGLATVAAGSYLKGNGTSPLVPRTASEVQSDLSISPAGAWIGAGLVVNNLVEVAAAFAADVTGTYFDLGFRLGAYGRLEGRGRVNTTTNYTGGATVCTLPSALRPAKDVTLAFRVGGAGATAGFLTIVASTGVVSFSANFTAGAGSWLQFDGVTVPRTVAGT